MHWNLPKRLLKLWILCIKICYATGELCTTSGYVVPKDCEYGCCLQSDGIKDDCCAKPFWTWGVIVGVVVAAIVGIVLVVFILLMCVYCKNKKTHTTRLRHTVSMRSNRISTIPMADLPPYEEIETVPYAGNGGVPIYDSPPKYEEVLSMDKTNNMPRAQPSQSLPTVSRTLVARHHT